MMLSARMLATLLHRAWLRYSFFRHGFYFPSNLLSLWSYRRLDGLASGSLFVVRPLNSHRYVIQVFYSSNEYVHTPISCFCQFPHSRVLPNRVLLYDFVFVTSALPWWHVFIPYCSILSLNVHVMRKSDHWSIQIYSTSAGHVIHTSEYIYIQITAAVLLT
jgi:hypothetical protein